MLKKKFGPKGREEEIWTWNGGKWYKSGENDITRSIMTCTPHRIIFGSSDSGSWGGWSMWHAWQRRVTHTQRTETTWKTTLS